MYLLSELCPGESLGQHMSNVMSNVQISFKDIRHKYQTSIELGEGVHIFFTNILVISFSHILWLTNLPIQKLLTQQRVEGKSVLCQCFATPNMSLVFCYKKSNMTKWYFWMSQNLTALNFNAICRLLQSLHKKTSDKAHRVLKHFKGWLKQSWLCILRSSFSKIVCSQCLTDQSINNSSTIDVTCFATIYQFKMIPSKWCVSKLLADQSFINHQQSFINYQHDTSNRSSLGWNKSPAQRPGRYFLRMMRP